MGLDMYLTAEKRLHPRRDEEESRAINALFPEVESSAIEVKFDIGYWRKANHIHKWFVDNVQGGTDDQKECFVSDSELKTLLDLCKKVSENHDLAAELLPTTGGFFFGSTDYGDYYFEEIEKTIKIIEKALALNDDFYLKYSASW